MVPQVRIGMKRGEMKWHQRLNRIERRRIKPNKNRLAIIVLIEFRQRRPFLFRDHGDNAKSEAKEQKRHFFQDHHM